MVKKLLLFHAILEMTAGLLLLWNPSLLGFVDGSHGETRHMVKLYGIAAFIFGVVSYQLWKHYASNDMFRRITLSIMAFHMMIGFYLVGLFRQGVMELPIAGSLHLLLAGFFAVAYMKEEAGKRD